MVYIPPVKHNQYDDYTERMMKKDYDPYYISSVSRTNGAAGNADSQEVKVKKTFKKKRTSIKKARLIRMNGRMISEITGKGRYFDEQI